MDILFAFLLTLFAGLATGIGSAIAFFARKNNYRFLSLATGFSAGVMLYVSFVEIFYKGADALTAAYGESLGNWVNVASFFGGIFLIGIIDALVPSGDNPHEIPERSERAMLKQNSENEHEQLKDRHLLRMGVFTALAIGIHNFPEGLATFLAALNDPGLGVAIAIAIALHNIPEGISVSVPIFYATGDRKKAFLLSLSSGMAEPVGAGIAYLFLRLFVADAKGVIPPQFMGILFAMVAGIMVYISLDELLPASRTYGKGHDSLIGLISGMMLMALSLLLMS